MSAYAHQMEREFSAQSLSSRGGSEMGSQYVVESGFYMTTFAAAIFIGGPITVGVLLITFLITLALMLQSCQSRSSGVVEVVKPSDDYNFCKIFAFYAEINSLGADDFPAICKGLAIRYIKGGQYARDLDFSVQLAESYFNALMPSDDGLDVVLMDIDDIFTPRFQYTNLVIDRLDHETEMDSREYLSRHWTIMQKEGFRITGLISNHMDALTGQCLGKRVFKLPNPLYFNVGHQMESTKIAY